MDSRGLHAFCAHPHTFLLLVPYIFQSAVPVPQLQVHAWPASRTVYLHGGLLILHVDQNVSNEYTLLYTPCSKVLSQTTLLCTPHSKVLPQESLLDRYTPASATVDCQL